MAWDTISDVNDGQDLGGSWIDEVRTAVTQLQTAIGTAEPLLALAPQIFTPFVSLLDNQAAYLNLGGTNALGAAILSANTDAGGNAVFAFRAGDASAFVRLLGSGGATVVGVVSGLAGTTGVDGNLTIGCPDNSPRIYIENRTGATRSYSIGFVGLRERTPPASWTIV